jgi:hypothetical protein
MTAQQINRGKRLRVFDTQSSMGGGCCCPQEEAADRDLQYEPMLNTHECAETLPSRVDALSARLTDLEQYFGIRHD